MTVRLTPRAERDLKALPADARNQVVGGLRELGSGADNADVKALRGRSGWLRLRIGDHRVLFRTVGSDQLVERILNRRDLEKALRTLH